MSRLSKICPLIISQENKSCLYDNCIFYINNNCGFLTLFSEFNIKNKDEKKIDKLSKPIDKYDFIHTNNLK